MAPQADGRTLVGGDFTLINGQARNHLARLSAEGTLEVAFRPEPNGHVLAVEAQADGRAFIGGEFTEAGGQVRRRVARLAAADIYSSNNLNDPSFNPQSGTMRAVAVQADGRILVGGFFTNKYGHLTHLARLNADGTLDSSFNPTPNVTGGPIYAIALQKDGRVLIGGAFTYVGGLPRMYLARLYSDGTVDNFIPWGGNYYTFYISSITLQANGKIIISGEGGRYMRLKANGAPDTPYGQYWGQQRDNAYSVLLQTDGRALLGGWPYGGLRRALNNEPALQELSVELWPDNSATIRWSRGGSAPEVERVTFEVSIDGGQTYNHVGDATHAPGGWILNGASLPLVRHILVRARGTHLATIYRSYPNASSGTATHESVRQFILYPSQPEDGPPTY